MTPHLLWLFLAAGAPQLPAATVTLPLDDARAWLVAPQAEAPLPAAVVAQRLTGRLEAESLEVTADFAVTVLDERWSRVSLLALGAGTTLVEATRLDGAVVAVQRGEVVLVSRQPGTYAVQLKLSVRAAGSPTRVATLRRGADAREGLLRVEADGERHALAHGPEVHSVDGAWTVRWTTRREAPAQAVAARPPMEPVITAARAQVVSTVEGRARLTLEYALALDREQPLTLALPQGWTLTRLGVNDAPRAVTVERALALTVSPARPGERTGKVELTLERDLGVFHLSGRLTLALPGVSWPTTEVEASVHLPQVFAYRRLGGSLEPVEQLAWSPPELPGTALRYRQHLVASAGPTLELAYAVALEGRYFSVRGASR